MGIRERITDSYSLESQVRLALSELLECEAEMR